MNKKSFIFFLFGSSIVWGLPSGSSVQTGGASVSTSTNSVEVSTSSTRNIINWSSFDLSSGESITFSRTGSNSTDTYYVFNKVTGLSATSMDGAISAGTNGIIYLVNPNGVVIGSNGTVVTGGFFVSALDISGSFQENIDLTFTGSGTVTVNGSITTTSADAICLGYRVVTGSSSSITAAGTTALGAGSDIIYQPSDAERIYIQTAGTQSTGTGIDHQGALYGGSIMVKADGNIYSLAINQRGTIQATSCSSSNGRIKLIADPKTNSRGALEMSGSISRACSTGTGPTVEIYGHSLALQNGSSIDVSGVTGGSVTIGTSSTANLSEHVYIHSGASITSTGTTGNGGAIDIYGGSSTLLLGSVTNSSTSANGGAVSANSPGYILVSGTVDSSSTSGTPGTFTMTGDVVKVGAAANNSTYFAPDDYVSASLDSVITETAIEAILALGNVTISATDIDVETVDINWSSGNLLTLTATEQIDISKLINMTGSSSTGSVAALTAPIINILSSSDVGVSVTSGNISATASNTFLLRGSTNGSALFQTASGTATVDFGEHLKLRGNGGTAQISATTTTINGQTANTGDLSLQGGSCGSAYIIGSTAVNIGQTTSVNDVEVVAGSCGSGLETGITGGSVSITAGGDLLVRGGASGSGNIARIKVNSGTQKDINITASSVDIESGTAGTNNSGRIINESNDGATNVTTTLDLKLTAGGASTTGSIADVESKTNTFTVGRDFHMQGGDGASSHASVYGYSGNTVNATGDIKMYSGTALHTHSKMETESGDVALTAGKSIYMYTGTSPHSHVYVTTNNGTVTFDTTHDIRMRGDCDIPNKAYIYSHGDDGHVIHNSARDISRTGNTEILARGTGTYTAPTGNYSFSACSGLSDTLVTSTSTTTTASTASTGLTELPDYYKYTFLYELFYRMNYFGIYDWYLFHSDDFWLHHTYTSP